MSTQTFDWSIIEEAGKAHGFDLVLPLHNGHRWLLIGDHKQLPPYRFSDFNKALLNLDSVVEALDSLPGRGTDLVDTDFIKRWRDEYSSEQKDKCRDLWLSWLPVFDRLFNQCAERTGRDGRPGLSQMLTHQHRMHPDIAELVSRAFYNSTIKSMTSGADGMPLDSVTHKYVGPNGLQGRAILWLNIPAAMHGVTGESSDYGPYTAPAEVEAISQLTQALKVQDGHVGQIDMAVLSPYRLQVFKLSEMLAPLYDAAPAWLAPLPGNRKPASTVDSFQGNQAKTVVVSLVRNNTIPNDRSAFGFLSESERMNVLMSRAEQLLILVGSWEFFESRLEYVPKDPKQPLGSLKLAIDYISECFEDGRAIKIDAANILGVAQ